MEGAPKRDVRTTADGARREVPSTRERVLVIGTKNKPKPGVKALPEPTGTVTAGEALRQEPIPERGPPLKRDKKAYNAAMAIFKDPKGAVARAQARAFNYALIDMDKPAPCIPTAFQNPTSCTCLIKIGDDINMMSFQEAKRFLTIDIHREFGGNKRWQGEQIGSCIPPLFSEQMLRHVKNNFLRFSRAQDDGG